MEARDTKFAAVGFLGGAAVGTLLWSGLLYYHRRELFSAHASRRYLALSYLAMRRDDAAARLLREYVRWERHEPLKRRGTKLLRRVEAALA